jgi:hypothetical protein
MNDAQIQAVADKVLRDAFGAFGYERAEVRFGFDQDDEPAIYVEALLRADTPPPSSKILTDAHLALREALLAEGEIRFPYFNTLRPDDEFAEDEGPVRARGAS